MWAALITFVRNSFKTPGTRAILARNEHQHFTKHSRILSAGFSDEIWNQKRQWWVASTCSEIIARVIDKRTKNSKLAPRWCQSAITGSAPQLTRQFSVASVLSTIREDNWKDLRLFYWEWDRIEGRGRRNSIEAAWSPEEKGSTAHFPSNRVGALRFPSCPLKTGLEMTRNLQSVGRHCRRGYGDTFSPQPHLD